jgi:hypothetical protein
MDRRSYATGQELEKAGENSLAEPYFSRSSAISASTAYFAALSLGFPSVLSTPARLKYFPRPKSGNGFPIEYNCASLLLQLPIRTGTMPATVDGFFLTVSFHVFRKYRTLSESQIYLLFSAFESCPPRYGAAASPAGRQGPAPPRWAARGGRVYPFAVAALCEKMAVSIEENRSSTFSHPPTKKP